jgi:hypothetical protein
MITNSEQICACKRAEYEIMCDIMQDVGLVEADAVKQLITDEFKRQHPCRCIEVPRIKAKIRLVQIGLYASTNIVPDDIADGAAITADKVDEQGNKRVYTDAEIDAAYAEAAALDTPPTPEE